MYIITDLTELHDNKVCVAVIDIETGACLRPLPYLSLAECQAQDLRPGKVVTFGRITTKPDIELPHVEDKITTFKVFRDATDLEFKTALEHGCFADAFGMPAEKKDLPFPNQALRSLITYRPQRLLLEESFGLRAWVDHWRFLPIKDPRYGKPNPTFNLNAENQHLAAAVARQEVLVRLGLTRPLKSGDAQKCYIQVNGIFTFLHGQRQL